MPLQLPILTTSGPGFLVATTAPYSLNGDGSTNNYVASGSSGVTKLQSTANAVGGDPYLPAGTYLIDGAVTVEFFTRVYFTSGAMVRLRNGAVLKFDLGVDAPILPIFDVGSGCSVQFGDGSMPEVYPEWWGAVPNSAGNNQIAINAALTAYPRVKLQPGGYTCSSPVIISNSNRQLIGSGWERTFVSLNAATGDTIQVTGSSSAYLEAVSIRDLTATRSTSSTTAAPIASTAPSGIRASYVVRLELDNTFSDRSAIGFYFGNTINVFASRCYATRGEGASGTACIGWYIDGKSSAGTNISPNASTRLTDCSVAISRGSGLYAGVATGFLINGNISDQFLLRPETSGCDIGIDIDGDTSAPFAGSRLKIDVHLIQPINDGILSTAIRIQNIRFYGAVSIVGGYSASGLNGAVVTGLLLANARGVSVTGGHQLVGFNNSASVGLRVDHCTDVSVSDCQVSGAQLPAYMNNSLMCKLDLMVFAQADANFTQPASVAVKLESCSRCYVVSTINGDKLNPSFDYTYGVTFDNQCGFNEVNATRINPGAIQYKVGYNGSPVTGSTFGGTNIVTGVLT